MAMDTIRVNQTLLTRGYWGATLSQCGDYYSVHVEHDGRTIYSGFINHDRIADDDHILDTLNAAIDFAACAAELPHSG